MQEIANVRNLVRTARTLNVTLPGEIAAILEHVGTIGGDVRSAAVSEATIIASLLQHLGDPGALTSCVGTALDQLARASVASTFAGRVETKAISTAWGTARVNREPIAEAFGQAVAPAVATLTEKAASIPGWMDEDAVGDLAPDVAAAYRDCQRAEDRIAAAIAGLLPLYTLPVETPLRLEARRRVIVVDVPDDLDFDRAWALVRALEGRRPVSNAMADRITSSATWWAAVAATGCRFTWAGPAAVADRITRITKACVPPVRVDAVDPRSRVVIFP